MIDLYYWTTPNGHKITMFLEEAGLEYVIKPPYAISYYCPVVMVLGRARQVQENGDLVEIDPERMGPVEPAWSA